MEQLEQTLAEQMLMTNHELEKRKKLLGLTKNDEELLLKHRGLFAKYLDGIVKNFYDKQIAFPEISLLIGDAETLRRLKSAMRRYILELFDGIYDMEYVNKRLRIGKVHQRIGVSPKLYISAIRLLEDVLQDTILMHQFGDDEFANATHLKKAVSKILMLDTQLVFDTYIASLVAEVETAKGELRDYANTLEAIVAERTAQLEELSTKDGLTAIYNQRAFYEHMRREMAAAERYKEPLTLVYLDLNGFKKLNDSKGHIAGDEVLTIVGNCLLSIFRETDIPCRYGGDEFAIIMPRTVSEEAKYVVERFIENFKENMQEKISFSVGIVTTGPEEFEDMETVIKEADKKMYKAKAKSKKKAGFYIDI